MPSRFVPDRAGIREFGRSRGMERALLRFVDRRVKPLAVSLTPVDTGRMKASWQTTSGVDATTAFGRIYNTAHNPINGYHYPAAIEFGNSRIKKQRVLGCTLAQLRKG